MRIKKLVIGLILFSISAMSVAVPNQKGKANRSDRANVILAEKNNAAVIPEPPALVLTLSGLLALYGVSRRKVNTSI